MRLSPTLDAEIEMSVSELDSEAMEYHPFCRCTPATILLLLLFVALPAAAQISSFQHVVVIFQENRTPDNLFQGLCSPPFGTAEACSVRPIHSQYNIQTSNWLDKTSATGVTEPTTIALANAYDLSHAHSAFVGQCDKDSVTGACKMDGSASVACSGTCPPKPQFRYVDNSTNVLNPYLQLATQYGWANYMFQTNQGPSFPAHQFIFGGTSAPSAADDAAGIFAAENMTNSGISGTNATAGCIADATTTVAVLSPNGTIKQMYPCFEHSTVPDVLSPSTTWRYYAPSAGSIWTAPNAIQHICQSTGPNGKCVGPAWTGNVDLTPANVLNDIVACKLRNISWVIPSGQNSDHANSNDGGGPSWVAAIVNAIGASTTCDNGAGYWRNTAIIITWDDWGGWYDHVRPSFLSLPGGDYQLGFRVPLIFVSAYTRAAYIDNGRRDFGSVLRFIEGNFGVQEGALHFADARAPYDLHEFYDFKLAPRSYQTISAPKDANFFLHDKRKATDPDDDDKDK
jgi:phospholipase C